MGTLIASPVKALPSWDEHRCPETGPSRPGTQILAAISHAQ